jgi:hypothetical protein
MKGEMTNVRLDKDRPRTHCPRHCRGWRPPDDRQDDSLRRGNQLPEPRMAFVLVGGVACLHDRRCAHRICSLTSPRRASDARLWHPWLSINRAVGEMLSSCGTGRRPEARQQVPSHHRRTDCRRGGGVAVRFEQWRWSTRSARTCRRAPAFGAGRAGGHCCRRSSLRFRKRPCKRCGVQPALSRATLVRRWPIRQRKAGHGTVSRSSSKQSSKRFAMRCRSATPGR